MERPGVRKGSLAHLPVNSRAVRAAEHFLLSFTDAPETSVMLGCDIP